MPGTSFSFEPADIVSRVMSLGADTPIEVAVSGQDLATSRAFAEKVKTKLEGIAVLRDVQFGQSLDYPTVEVKVDRERAGIIGPDMKEVSKALVPATWSSRFMNLNFWADPNSGVAYQVQVQIPQRLMTSLEDVGNLPVLQHKPKDPEKKVKDVTLRNLSEITEGTAMAEYQRYNMQRVIGVRANLYGNDLAGAARQVRRAIAELGPPPPGVTVAVRPGDGGGGDFLIAGGKFPVSQNVFCRRLNGSGGAGGRGPGPVADGYDPQHPVVYGRDYGRRRGRRKRNSAGDLRRKQPAGRGGSGECGRGGRARPVASDSDDQCRNDRGNGPYGAERGRIRRAGCPAGTRRHRRIVNSNTGDTVCAAIGLRRGAKRQPSACSVA